MSNLAATNPKAAEPAAISLDCFIFDEFSSLTTVDLMFPLESRYVIVNSEPCIALTPEPIPKPILPAMAALLSKRLVPSPGCVYTWWYFTVPSRLTPITSTGPERTTPQGNNSILFNSFSFLMFTLANGSGLSLMLGSNLYNFSSLYTK
ncbi:hypothetical protein D3C85_1508170 [compost metagenome]